MKLLVIAILTMTSGATVEVTVQSMQICEAMHAALAKGETVQVEDEAGVLEHVAAVQCKPTLVHTPDVEGEDV